MKKTILVLLILTLGAFVASCSKTVEVNDFESCVDAGNSVVDSDPKMCGTKNGSVFTEEAMACTMDAMECPDGSFVGRDGYNNCEFEACPGQ